MTNLTDPIFHDEDKARAHFEAIRWPNGPYCPHCGNADEDEITKLTSKAHRAGLYQCRECREQFTVTVGSVMERSHIPLHKWALGFLSDGRRARKAYRLTSLCVSLALAHIVPLGLWPTASVRP